MRIITGSAKGVSLLTLEGDATRPTSARAKEALFSMLQFDIEGRRVLDLFGGSGQLGLEALSRGAVACTFVDAAPEAVAVIRKNIEKTGFADRARVQNTDYRSFLRKYAADGFDLVFLDPPYVLSAGVVSAMLKHLVAQGALRSGATVVYERSSQAPGLDVPGLIPMRTKRYGITCVDLLEKGQDVD